MYEIFGYNYDGSMEYDNLIENANGLVGETATCPGTWIQSLLIR